MVIVRTESELDSLLDHFERNGYDGPPVFEKGIKRPLLSWKECMKEELKENGLLIFTIEREWLTYENRLQETVYWRTPHSVEGFIKIDSI